MQKVRDDQKSLTEFLEAEQEKRYQNLLTGRERELRQLDLEYEAKKKLAHGNKEILVQLDNELFAQRLGIESKYFTASKQIKAAGVAEETKIKADGLRSTIQFATDEELVQYETQQSITRISAEEQQKRIEMAFAVAGSLMSIMDSLSKNDKEGAKRRFNINKALGIAQAGINTYMAVNAALTAGGNPIKLATGAQFVEAGVALTMGLANVAKIASTKFNDGGGSTAPSGGGGMSMGASGGGGSTSAPALDLSFINNKNTGAQPIQSYVLATNVTSAQDAQQKILDQSKLIK